MLYEGNSLNQSISIRYCDARFARYGALACLPLRTAVITTDVYYLIDFKWAFVHSGENHRDNQHLAKFINGLTYENSGYFTVEETRFLLQLHGSCPPLSPEQIEADRCEVLREIKRKRGGKNMLKSHATILLKAIDFWKSHYDEKYEQWRLKFVATDRASTIRAKLAAGTISPGEAASGVIIEDEGYQSSYYDSDESES
jgi:hypothetical protein